MFYDEMHLGKNFHIFFCYFCILTSDNKLHQWMKWKNLMNIFSNPDQINHLNSLRFSFLILNCNAFDPLNSWVTHYLKIVRLISLFWSYTTDKTYKKAKRKTISQHFIMFCWAETWFSQRISHQVGISLSQAKSYKTQNKPKISA